MNVHRKETPRDYRLCTVFMHNYARNGRSECSAHNIEARDLFNAVLADINCFADMAVNDEKAVRAIEKRLTETDQSRAKALEKERKKLNKRLAELDRLFSLSTRIRSWSVLPSGILGRCREKYQKRTARN